jgi:redox-sensitive bicupin YhaK (pirin superfamily)
LAAQDVGRTLAILLLIAKNRCEAHVFCESIAHYGAFVMNTRAEIEQAISDYQLGCLAA